MSDPIEPPPAETAQAETAQVETTQAETAQADAAQRHQATAAHFATLIEGTADWQVATPVKEWVARDIVAHLIQWLPGFLSGASGVALAAVDLPEASAPDAGPRLVAAWQQRAAEVQAVLEDPALSAVTVEHPGRPTQSLAQTIDAFYTFDIYLHSWDLARASGQAHGLDQNVALAALPGMQSIEPMLRASGQFGDRAMPVADDAEPIEKLMALCGRDPGWAP